MLRLSTRLALTWEPKVDSVALLDKRAKTLAEADKVTHDLAILHEELSALPALPEIEWTRMRAIEFQDVLKQRLLLNDRVARLTCVKCPDFDDHVGLASCDDRLIRD